MLLVLQEGLAVSYLFRVVLYGCRYRCGGRWVGVGPSTEENENIRNQTASVLPELGLLPSDSSDEMKPGNKAELG